MRCLVTGGAGFIGSHLCELLTNEGHEVVVLDNLASGRIKNLEGLPVEFYPVDIRSDLLPYFKGIDWVFHLAGLADIVPSIENPEGYYDVNVTGTLKVLEAAKRAQVSRFIYAASSSCYGIPELYPTPESSSPDPQYPYALTKYLGEELVLHWARVYALPAVSLRLFNVFGPRARTTGTYGAVFGVFLAQKLHGKPMTVVGDGTQTRDFTYVTDVARAFLKAAESDVVREVFNVGSGGHYSVNRLVKLLEGAVTFIPKRPGEPGCTFADVTKIRSELGWQAEVSFEKGVEALLLSIEEFRDAPLWEPSTIKEATKSWFDCLNDEEAPCSNHA